MTPFIVIFETLQTFYIHKELHKTTWKVMSEKAYRGTLSKLTIIKYT